MEMSLNDVVRTLWDKKWLIAILTAYFVAVAFYFWTQQPEMYKATVVMESNSDSSVDVINTLVGTYDKLISTRTVAEIISEKTKPKIATEKVLGRARVEYVSGTRLFQVNVVDSDPKTAVKLANASASGLAEYLSNKQIQQNMDIEKNLGERFKEIKDVVDRNMASGFAPSLTSSAAQDAVASQFWELYLTSASQQMENAGRPQPVSIIDKATSSTRVLNTSKGMLLVIAILLGLLVSSSLVVIFNQIKESYGQSKTA